MTQFREITERYQLEKILKSSRSGTVLRAVDSQSGRTVAVKLITVGPSPGLEAGAPVFEKLTATLSSFRHPNFPTVLDSGFTPDGSAFLVMELLQGRGLETLAGAPPARVLSLLGQILSGLEVLAVKGLAHHNLSSDNVWVIGPEAEEQVKILGLGSAIFRARGPASGPAIGENARFRAPELTAQGVPADLRADIYSLALIASQTLGATVGFGDSPVVQMPLALSFELDNDEALRNVLERSLRENPAERPSLREIREAFRLALGGTQAPVPPIQLAPVHPLRPAVPPVSDPFAGIPEAWAPSSVPVGLAGQASAAALPLEEAFREPMAPPSPDPAESGEVLTTVDDEVLNALLAVPPPPPRPAGPPARGERGKVVPFAQRPKDGDGAAEGHGAVPEAGGKRSRAGLIAALAGLAVLVLAGVGAYLVLNQPAPETAAAPLAPIPPPAPPQRPAAERLEEARLFFAQGEDNRARLVLRSITFADQGTLPPAGCRALSVLEETLALSILDSLPADLAAGLKAGDLAALQSAVSAASEQGVLSDLPPAVRADFDRARGLMALYGQAQAAAAGARHAEVLEHFAALQALLPDLVDATGLREKAAAALEAEAEGLAREARYDEGLARLAPLQRAWPDRDGLAEKVKAYESYKVQEAEQEALLAKLPGFERRKKPHETLEVLNEVEPTPHLADRFAEARKRSEDQLTQLDGQPPQVALREGYYLKYARGMTIELSFRITDDYQVGEVKLLARPEGGKMRELPLSASRNGNYTVQIPASFHQNGTVEFYVVAKDLSGHEGTLGSPGNPQRVTRQ
jgi:serine/threonine-protein kinase